MVLTLPRASDHVFASEHAQPLGNRGHRFAFHSRQFAHAAFALSEPGCKPQPGRVSKRPEKPRRPIYRRLAHQQRGERRMTVYSARFVAFRLHALIIAHFIICASVLWSVAAVYGRRQCCKLVDCRRLLLEAARCRACAPLTAATAESRFNLSAESEPTDEAFCPLGSDASYPTRFDEAEMQTAKWRLQHMDKRQSGRT
jgi:hypothetical protein